MTVTVLGGGLAGSEAAWALAERGVAVTLVEMRPVVRTAAHQTDRLGRTRLLQHLQEHRTHQRARPAQGGDARCSGSHDARVRRRRARARRQRRSPSIASVFAPGVHERVHAHPRITVVREEVTTLPDAGIIATGPLTSDALADGDPRAPRWRRARVLRRDRADRRRRLASTRRIVFRAVALRQGDDGRRARRRLPQLPVDARRVRGVHRRARRGRPVHRARVRRGAVLRGVHAGRGDGASAGARPCASGR